jgi:hypothetical protein
VLHAALLLMRKPSKQVELAHSDYSQLASSLLCVRGAQLILRVHDLADAHSFCVLLPAFCALTGGTPMLLHHHDNLGIIQSDRYAPTWYWRTSVRPP